LRYTLGGCSWQVGQSAAVSPVVTPTATRDPEQAPEYVVSLPLIVK
jgi:hypothetical protein